MCPGFEEERIEVDLAAVRQRVPQPVRHGDAIEVGVDCAAQTIDGTREVTAAAQQADPVELRSSDSAHDISPAPHIEERDTDRRESRVVLLVGVTAVRLLKAFHKERHQTDLSGRPSRLRQERVRFFHEGTVADQPGGGVRRLWADCAGPASVLFRPVPDGGGTEFGVGLRHEWSPVACGALSSLGRSAAEKSRAYRGPAQESRGACRRSIVIHVRRATLDDLEQMIAVYSAAWRDAFADMFSIATFVDNNFEPQRSAEVRDIVLDDSVTTKVVEHHGRIVGFSGLADDGCLDDIWVHPSSWGAGAAPVLIASHEDEQRSVGRNRLTSWVPEDSPRARGLMIKLGWQLTGEEQPMVIYPEQPNRLFEYHRVLV